MCENMNLAIKPTRRNSLMPDTTFRVIDPTTLKGRDLVQADPQLPRQTFRGPIEHVKVTDVEVVFTVGWVAMQGSEGLKWKLLPKPPYIITTVRDVPVVELGGTVQFHSGLCANRILAAGDNVAKPN